jgi:hypothetical protein
VTDETAQQPPVDDGYVVWKAMMEDAVDRGDVKFLQATSIGGYVIPATYWNPAVERHPRLGLYAADALLASACACRGSLHQQCVYPTIMRGEGIVPMRTGSTADAEQDPT